MVLARLLVAVLFGDRSVGVSTYWGRGDRVWRVADDLETVFAGRRCIEKRLLEFPRLILLQLSASTELAGW